VRHELKDFLSTMLTEKLLQMYNKIDEAVKIEEVMHVNSPEILEARYKEHSTENQKLWNVALCKST
jgi:hypothetical protein